MSKFTVINNRLDRFNKALHGQGGLSLLECMIAIFVFAIGMLGATAYIIGGYKYTALSSAKAAVVHTASQTFEPMLYQANSADNIHAVLATFPKTVKGENSKDYVVKLVYGKDGGGTQIISLDGNGLPVIAAASTWKSPVTFTLATEYGKAIGGSSGETVSQTFTMLF